MAEALVSAILQQITPIMSEEVRLLRGVKKDLKKLEINLTSIRALLKDAEEKQISDKPVRLWLDRLKEESLDMEDALDEWRTVFPYRPTKGAETAAFLLRKVRLYLQCFSFHRAARYHHIACNINQINGRLDEIARQRDSYQLIAASNDKSSSRNERETTSVIEESDVIGRDEVKREIIGHLLSGTSGSPIQTISIVGMGGLGKTALAQLIYNDEDVKQYFTSRIWTCVSDVFDERKLAKAIAGALEGLDNAAALLQLELLPLDALLQKICKSIEGKKYLLILDDVWTEKDDDFNELNVALKRGAPGSRILVTTRKDTVARVMGSSHTIGLEKLSQDVCWSILSKKALRGRDQKNCEDLQEIGLRIAEKCKGSPLVAKTLGGLLRFKDTKQQWQNVLNSDLWKMEIVHKDVFVPLLLSYYDLPSPIRRCFTYCAIFAKDDRFYPCHLIGQWRAQGYLGFDDGHDLALDIKGFEYFKCLEARSFFQDVSCGYHVTCKMHDMVHDFAIFLTNGEFMTKEVSRGESSERIQEKSTITPRHLTMMVEKRLHFPESISNAEKLRSVKAYGEDAVISEKALRNLFKQAIRLRLLELDMRAYHGSTIPEEIGGLLHLRYLNLQFSHQLKRLPKALCRLPNLEYLDLYDCPKLESLPDEIGNLVNLKFLRTAGCSDLTCYPKGVGRLIGLTQLMGGIVRVDRDDPKELSIGDLANMKQLLLLSMVIVGNTINVAESKKVKLQNLQEVKILVDGDIEEAEDDILESLNMSSVPRWSFEDDYLMYNHFRTPRNECHYYGF